jgi:hypothetical protein
MKCRRRCCSVFNDSSTRREKGRGQTCYAAPGPAVIREETHRRRSDRQVSQLSCRARVLLSLSLGLLAGTAQTAWGPMERRQQLLLLPVPTVTRLKPSSVARLAIEIKAAVAAHAAVVGTGADKGRLGRPSERALAGGEACKLQDDLLDRRKALRGSTKDSATLMIRSCMLIAHRTDTTGGLLLTSFEPAGFTVKRRRCEC